MINARAYWWSAVIILIGCAGRSQAEELIVLGERSVFSGPSAGLGVEVWRGEFAAFSAANDAAATEGRRIKLVLVDDKYEPDSAIFAAKELIDKRKIFALFGGVGTPTIVRVLPLLLEQHQQEGLFQFSNFTGAQAQREPPYEKYVFNVRASYRQEIAAMVKGFVAMGRKKIGLFLQDDAYGLSGKDGAVRTLQERGLTVIAETRYPRGQGFSKSNQEQVAVLKNAGVDAIIAVGAYAACAGMIRDVRMSKWDVPIHNVSFVGADQLLDLLHEFEKTSGQNVTSNLITTQVVPSYLDLNVPFVGEYRAAMDRYHPTVPADVGDHSYSPARSYSFGSLEGYLNARVFLEILKRAGKNATRSSFYQAAEHMGRFDLGLGVPLEFSKKRHQALDEVWMTHATATGWSPQMVAF